MMERKKKRGFKGIFEEIGALFFLFVLFGSFLILDKSMETGEPAERSYDESVISDIQAIACSIAHDAGTCDTKLSELELVSAEDCCTHLGKCC